MNKKEIIFKINILHLHNAIITAVVMVFMYIRLQCLLFGIFC